MRVGKSSPRTCQGWGDTAVPDNTSDAGLAVLENQVRRDLKAIDHPKLKWLPVLHHPDGCCILDVLVVGACQSGIATGYALKREQVDNVAVIDRAPYGKEGPLVTFAQMWTLRSPKDYPAPTFGFSRWPTSRGMKRSPDRRLEMRSTCFQPPTGTIIYFGFAKLLASTYRTRPHRQ